MSEQPLELPEDEVVKRIGVIGNDQAATIQELKTQMRKDSGSSKFQMAGRTPGKTSIAKMQAIQAQALAHGFGPQIANPFRDKLEGLDIPKEYALVMEKKSNLSALMRKAVIRRYHSGEY